MRNISRLNAEVIHTVTRKRFAYSNSLMRRVTSEVFTNTKSKLRKSAPFGKCSVNTVKSNNNFCFRMKNARDWRKQSNTGSMNMNNIRALFARR